MAMAPEQIGIGIRRHFTRAGRRTRTTRSSGSGATRASRTSRTAPTPSSSPTSSSRSSWSQNATNIVAQKYFRGTLGTAGARDVAAPGDRPRRRHDHRRGACATATSSTTHEAEAFRDELKYVLVHQRAAFNSPVWFNIGVKGVPQQASACFILAGRRHDGRRSSTGTAKRASIFKGGSGSGINLSNIRSSQEHLKGGGTASGPGELHARRRRVGRHDQVGRQDPPRREDGHPQRRPPRHRGVHLVQGDRGAQGAGAARRRLRHGPRRQRQPLDPVPEREQLGARHRRVHAGRASTTATGQLKAVTTGEPVQDGARRATSCARSREAAWECADPGMQFDTTINRWHTAPNTGRINAQQPVLASTCTSTTRRATSRASTC